MGVFAESVVEQATLAWRVTHGLDIAPAEAGAERTEDGLVVSTPVKGSRERFRAASRRKIES